MIDPLIKIIKNRVGVNAEILYDMDNLKATMTNTGIGKKEREIVKMYAASTGMVINKKKCAIQLNPETPLPESLQDVPRLDGMT